MAASLYCKVLVLVRLILLLQAVAPETCTRPDPAEHAQVVHVDDNKHVFQENETVQYECQAGYYMAGGANKRTCQNGEWSRFSIRCRPRYCPYIDDPINGLRLDSNHLAGKRTFFQCNRGYNMVGPRQLLCRTNGRWMPNTAPVCEIVHCPEIRRFANGRMAQHTTDGERNVYGVEIEYICDEGYVRVGSERRRCEADGQWEGAPPICDEPKCPDLGEFENGQIVYDDEDRSVFSSVYFLCDDDSDMIPNRENLVCRSISGTIAAWSDTPPKCLRRSKIAPKKHTVMSQYVRRRWTQFHAETEFMHGQQIKIACTAQHELKNSAGYVDRKTIVSTNRNGNWTPEIPDCVKLRCDLSVHKHMVFASGSEPVAGKVAHGLSVVGRCANRYEYKFTRRDPTVTRTCNKGKLYMPRCIPRTCRIEEQPHAAYTDGPSAGSYLEDNVRVPTGVNVYVRCVGRSYELYSAYSYMTSFHSTCDHGDWSRNTFPVCRARRCDLTVSSTADYWTERNRNNQTISENRKVESGTEVNIKCIYGHALTGGDVAGDGGGGGGINIHGHRQRNTASFTCGKGIWSAEYQCLPRGCLVPDIPNGEINHSDSIDTVANGQRVSVTCKRKHSLRLVGKKVTRFQAECRLGDWFPARFPICEPARCDLSIMAGSNYWTKPSNEEYHVLAEDTEIKSEITVYTNCTDGYDLMYGHEFNFGNVTKSVKCSKGSWTKIYSCKRKKCSIDHPDSVIITRRGVVLELGDSVFVNEQVAVQCAADFEHVDKAQTDPYHTTCQTNTSWSLAFPNCTQRSCQLPNIEAGHMWAKQNGVFINMTSDTVAHDNPAFLNCTKRHELYSETSQFKTGDAHGMFKSVCQRGEWEPTFAECVPGRCRVPKTSDHLVLTKNGQPVNWTFMRHGTKVNARCKTGYHLPRGTGERLDGFTNGCEFGKWVTDFPICQKNAAAKTTTTVTASTSTEGQLPVTAPLVATERTSMPSPTLTTSLTTEEAEEACTIAASDVYTFGDDTDDILDVGTHVAAGDVVYVNCKDLADVIGSYDDYVVLYNATCKAGELVGEYPSHCKPMTAEVKCSVDHGTVIREKFDRLHHTISCEAGYQLSVGTPKLSVSTLMFTCKQGRLEHEVSDWCNPVCEPVGCVLPDMLPHGVTVSRVDGTVLNEREEISHDSDVVVTCPKTMEPSGRRFRCHLGYWEDGDDNWDWHSNTTQFPKCRNATCNCENNGTCIRDAECRCGDGVKGKRCQKFVCHPDCDRNGGTCVSPNTCGSCPIPKYGSNCEKITVVQYRISVETGPRQLYTNLFQGTDANVYIKIAGAAGSTGIISLDKNNAQRRRNLFEAGNTDVFVVNTFDVGNIKNITVSHDDANSQADWYLQSVVVLVQSKGQQYWFSIGKWLDQDTGLSVTSRPTSADVVEYRISVETASRQLINVFQGTDAIVYIKIAGAASSTVEISLDSSNAQCRRTLFAAGNIDVFVVKTLDVGDIKSITVSYDGPNVRFWYPKSVVVLVQSKGQQYRFSIAKWLHPIRLSTFFGRLEDITSMRSCK